MCDWFSPEGLTAVGTLAVAAVAIFQDTLRNLVYHPFLDATIGTKPPDCSSVPFSNPMDGTPLADCLYMRLWVRNSGKAAAKNVEVYADKLLKKRADNEWELVDAFPPMNLRWANFPIMLYPVISPEMGKHCDLAHIVDPAKRQAKFDPNNPKSQTLEENNPRLGLTDQQTSLAFDLIASPNHKGHIIGPGEYRLEIKIAAENAGPKKKIVEINLGGEWYPDEAKMLRDGIGVVILTNPLIFSDSDLTQILTQIGQNS